MLHWANESTPEFNELLEYVIEFARDIAYDNSKDGSWMNNEDWFSCSKIFSDVDSFGNECQNLISAIHSPELLMPTEYHFYLIYNVLETFLDFAIDDPKSEEYRLFMKLGKDFKVYTLEDIFLIILDYFFWDLDFLMNPEEFNRLNKATKELMDFSDGTFGVVNQLQPTAEELVMKEIVPEEC
jgi:hypothetical protein